MDQLHLRVVTADSVPVLVAMVMWSPVLVVVFVVTAVDSSADALTLGLSNAETLCIVHTNI